MRFNLGHLLRNQRLQSEPIKVWGYLDTIRNWIIGMKSTSAQPHQESAHVIHIITLGTRNGNFPTLQKLPHFLPQRCINNQLPFHHTPRRNIPPLQHLKQPNWTPRREKGMDSKLEFHAGIQVELFRGDSSGWWTGQGLTTEDVKADCRAEGVAEEGDAAREVGVAG